MTVGADQTTHQGRLRTPEPAATVGKHGEENCPSWHAPIHCRRSQRMCLHPARKLL